MALLLKFDGTGVSEDEIIEWLQQECWNGAMTGIDWEVIEDEEVPEEGFQ